jgi:Fe-S-cluster-containing dehydrogenase component
MKQKLIIDLAKCKPQEESGVKCSYKHHPENQGFDSLLEMIRFALICRRCQGAPCIKACPREALEKVDIKNNDAGILRRSNMLCTSCGSCAIACPFGTIYPALVPFPSSVCDVCRDRLSDGENPLCVRTAGDGSIDFGQVETGGDLTEVFDDIVVKVSGGVRWEPFLRGSEKVKK